MLKQHVRVLTDLYTDSWYKHALASLALRHQPPISGLSVNIYLINDHAQRGSSNANNQIMQKYELDVRTSESYWRGKAALDLGRLLDAVLPNLSAITTATQLTKHDRFLELEVRFSTRREAWC